MRTLLLCSLSLLLPLTAGAQSKPPSPAEVLAAARSFADGGGYDASWKGTGVPVAIEHGGASILKQATGGTYCCGFTFAVAMRAALKRKWLARRSAAEVRQLQRHWYGATKDSAERQIAYALEEAKLGSAVAPRAARPGDFVMFWRSNKSGHSAIFLGWLVKEGERVGLRYRSSQRSTQGIGDSSERFAGHGGKVLPDRLYLARFGKPRR